MPFRAYSFPDAPGGAAKGKHGDGRKKGPRVLAARERMGREDTRTSQGSCYEGQRRRAEATAFRNLVSLRRHGRDAGQFPPLRPSGGKV
jgi:hypothetical protein